MTKIGLSQIKFCLNLNFFNHILFFNFTQFFLQKHYRSERVPYFD